MSLWQSLFAAGVIVYRCKSTELPSDWTSSGVKLLAVWCGTPNGHARSSPSLPCSIIHPQQPRWKNKDTWAAVLEVKQSHMLRKNSNACAKATSMIQTHKKPRSWGYKVMYLNAKNCQKRDLHLCVYGLWWSLTVRRHHPFLKLPTCLSYCAEWIVFTCLASIP